MELALYRKYRPQSFADVKGQDDIINILRKQIAGNDVGHAYLFSGGRGTGKTTVARIFAGEIGVKPEDLYELDAASNRSIDDIRELREAVKTLPFSSPYKCYIIDEVHMLTKEAFNALLKTLEEPPRHVIFILATTNLEKVLPTIISRCQTFGFKQPIIRDLALHISDVVAKEGLMIDAESAELIALAGNGSFRDALSTLEKVLAIYEPGLVLDINIVAKIIGAPRHEIINNILRGISESNSEKALMAVREASMDHVDMDFFLRVLLMKIRAVLLMRYAPSMESSIAEEFSPDDVEFIRTLAKDSNMRINSHTLLEFLGVSGLIGNSVVSTLPIELAIIRTIAERGKTV
jgi:DNA polymerase-3 subunit gamma/tau